MSPAPDNVIQLYSLLKNPVRTDVLLALEQGERSRQQLEREIDATPNQIEDALEKLQAAGLVVVVRTEPALPARNTTRSIYDASRRDWSTYITLSEQWAPDAPSS